MQKEKKTRVLKSSFIGDDDFVSLVKDGIIIHFHLKNRSIDMVDVFRTVKKAQSLVREKFGVALRSVRIEIYDSMHEMRQDGRSRSRYASWIAGIYDGTIRIVSEEDSDAQESLNLIIIHEIIHLAIDVISKGCCPYWLDEGLAVLLTQELPDEYTELLRIAVRNNTIIPLEILEKSLPTSAEERIRQLAYAQVVSVTAYLIANYGWDTIKSFVFFSKQRNIGALLSELSLNYYLLEQAWKRWVRIGGA